MSRLSAVILSRVAMWGGSPRQCADGSVADSDDLLCAHARMDPDGDGIVHDLGRCSTGGPELVEVWFFLIERQAIPRGVFTSVKDRNTRIRTFIDGWNDRSHPFAWTKTAEEILKKANRPTTSNPRH